MSTSRVKSPLDPVVFFFAAGFFSTGLVSFLAGACGLGTGLLFSHDLVSNPVLPRNGEIYFSRPTPDEILLKLANSRVVFADQNKLQNRMIRAWYAGAIKLVSESVREAVEQW